MLVSSFVSEYRGRWRVQMTLPVTDAQFSVEYRAFRQGQVCPRSLVTVATVPDYHVAVSVASVLSQFSDDMQEAVLRSRDATSVIREACDALPADDWYLRLWRSRSARDLESLLRLPSPWLGKAAADGIRNGLRRIMLETVAACDDPRMMLRGWRAVTLSDRMASVELEFLQIEGTGPSTLLIDPPEQFGENLEIGCDFCDAAFDVHVNGAVDLSAQEPVEALREELVSIRRGMSGDGFDAVVDPVAAFDDDGIDDDEFDDVLLDDVTLDVTQLVKGVNPLARAYAGMTRVLMRPAVSQCVGLPECDCPCHALEGWYEFDNPLVSILESYREGLNTFHGQEWTLLPPIYPTSQRQPQVAAGQWALGRPVNGDPATATQWWLVTVDESGQWVGQLCTVASDTIAAQEHFGEVGRIGHEPLVELIAALPVT